MVLWGDWSPWCQCPSHPNEWFYEVTGLHGVSDPAILMNGSMRGMAPMVSVPQNIHKQDGSTLWFSVEGLSACRMSMLGRPGSTVSFTASRSRFISLWTIELHYGMKLHLCKHWIYQFWSGHLEFVSIGAVYYTYPVSWNLKKCTFMIFSTFSKWF